MSRAINGSATDDAIAKIKELIRSGEFGAGSKLPNERSLAERFGLSRSSLREALRALALVGVVEAKVGNGTFVTTLETDMLLTGIGLVSDLLAGSSLLDMHDVRKILEPEATRRAASRLTEDDFEQLAACLEEMDRANTRPAFAEAEAEFHRIVVNASGNPMLASFVLTLARGTAQARLWRSLMDRDALEATKFAHQRIYDALLARDEAMASAANLMYLGASSEWVQAMAAKLEEDPAWSFSNAELAQIER
jgi:GntR family transcriptional repressor for pyruvate dehydrogenase complex